MKPFLANELFAKIREDNEEAFEYVFLYFYGKLCSYASILLSDKTDSEEVVQEVLAKLWENQHKNILKSIFIQKCA